MYNKFYVKLESNSFSTIKTSNPKLKN